VKPDVWFQAMACSLVLFDSKDPMSVRCQPQLLTFSSEEIVLGRPLKLAEGTILLSQRTTKSIRDC
jgi:hypothetical protein